jgi:hypothetical protein
MMKKIFLLIVVFIFFSCKTSPEMVQKKISPEKNYVIIPHGQEFLDYNLIRNNNINAIIYYYPINSLRRSRLTISGKEYNDDLRKSYEQKIEVNTVDAKIFLLNLEDLVLENEEIQGIDEGDVRCCVDFYIKDDIIFSYAISFGKFYMYINGSRMKNNDLFYDFINNYININ